jgi:hypothetical protein
VVNPSLVLRDRGGRSRLRTLLTLLFVVVFFYYGIDVGAVYFRRWQLVEEMKSLARLAPSLDDATIRRRLTAKVEALGLPESAYRFEIRRLQRPREIRISTYYEETVELPFTTYTFKIRPLVRAPL